MFNNWLN